MKMLKYIVLMIPWVILLAKYLQYREDRNMCCVLRFKNLFLLFVYSRILEIIRKDCILSMI